MWQAPVKGARQYSSVRSPPRFPSRRGAVLTRASLKEDAVAFIKSDLYAYYGQAGIVVVILGLVDAGWSGDWSRIGTITPEQEQQCRDFAGILGIVHVVCASSAAVIAKRRGQDWIKPFAKTLVVGVTPLVEVLVRGAEPEAVK